MRRRFVIVVVASAPRMNIIAMPKATKIALRFEATMIAVITIANGITIASGFAKRWSRLGVTSPSRRSGNASVDHGAAKLRSGKGKVSAIGTTAATEAPRAIHSMTEVAAKTRGKRRKGIAGTR